MRALNPDFAKPTPWLRVATWALSAILLAIFAWQGILAVRGYRELVDERARTAELHHQLDIARASVSAAQAPASAPTYERDARSIARMSSVDVGGILRSIESAQIVGVKVTNIDIDTATRAATVDIAVPNAETAAAYVEALNAGEDQPRWILARLQAQTGGDTAEIRTTIP